MNIKHVIIFTFLIFGFACNVHAVSTFTYTDDAAFANFQLDRLGVYGTGKDAKIVAVNKWDNINTPYFPQARHSYGLGYDSTNSKAFLFGGTNGSDTYSDMFLFDLQYLEWEQITALNKPSARYGHQITSLGSGRFLLFGGYNSAGGYMNDTWLYDLNLNTWLNQDYTVKPPSRAYASMAAVLQDNKVYMFGGRNGPGFMNDLWAYDIIADSWSYVSVVSSPPVRMRSAMAYSTRGNYLLIYGGSDNTRLNDMWRYNPDSNTYQKINLAGSTPGSISDFVFAYLPNIDRFCLYGGYNGTMSGATWIYDYDMNKWVAGTYENFPGNRMNSSGFVSSAGALYIYGGNNGMISLDDTWKYLIYSSGTFSLSASVTAETSIQWNKLNLFGTVQSSTSIKCQVAASNNGFIWEPYAGPDGTQNTYYTGVGSFNLWEGHNDKSFLKLRGQFNSLLPPIMPELSEIQIVYNISPNAPVLSAPADNSSTNSKPAFTWNKAYDRNGDPGFSYRIQVSENASFSPKIIDSIIFKTTAQVVTFIPQASLKTVQYYWRVYAQDTSTGPWSDVYSFDIDTIAPAAVSGMKAVTGNINGKIELAWKSPGEDGTLNQIINGQYLIRFSSSILIETEDDWEKAGGEITASFGAVPGDTILSAIENLQEATTYSIAIKVKDKAGNASLVSVNNPLGFTNARPQVSLLEPDGGEILAQKNYISWAYSDQNIDDPALITIKTSSDSGNNYDILIVSGLPNGTTSYNWDSRQVSNGENYRIKVIVTDSRAFSGEDSSEQVFTVNNYNEIPSLSLLNPSYGDTLHDNVSINWELIDKNMTDIHDISVFISSDNGTNYSLLNKFITGTTFYLLNTQLFQNGINYVVKIHIAEINTAEKYSREALSGRFTIINNNFAPNSFDLLYPSSGAYVSTIKLTITWQDNGDPNPEDLVLYTLNLSTNADFSGSLLVSGISENQYVLSPPLIEENQKYYWRVYATDKIGTVTVSNEIFIFNTLNRYHAVSEDGVIFAKVVSGMPEDSFMSIEQLPIDSGPDLIKAQNYAIGGRLAKMISDKIYKVELKDINQLPVETQTLAYEIKYNYRDSNNDSYEDGYLIPVDKLKVAYFEENAKKWVFDASKQEIDRSTKKISALFHKPAYLTIAGSNGAGQLLSNINAFPNPFSPNIEPLHLSYALNQDAEMEIKIYTLIGDLVRKWEYEPGIPGKSTGAQEGYVDEITWDGKNGTGDVVANGMYLCVIEARSGAATQKETRNVGVVR